MKKILPQRDKIKLESTQRIERHENGVLSKVLFLAIFLCLNVYCVDTIV